MPNAVRVKVLLFFCPSRDLFLTDQPIRQTSAILGSRMPKGNQSTQQGSSQYAGSVAWEASGIT